MFSGLVFDGLFIHCYAYSVMHNGSQGAVFFLCMACACSLVT